MIPWSPIVVEHHVLDTSLSVPTQVSGQLTFNSTAGTTYYYDTSLFTKGDDQQIALQANATALSTGRYAYTVTVGDIRGTTPRPTSTAPPPCSTASPMRSARAGRSKGSNKSRRPPAA